MTTGIDVEVRMVGSERFQTLIDPLKQSNILGVIAMHLIPRACFALHAAKPEVFARMCDFAATAEDATEVVEFITIELEELARNLQCINGLEWRWSMELVGDEAGARLLKIEGIPIVSDDDISRVQNAPKVLH